MCGIAGFSGDFGVNLFTRMNGKLSRRGPAGSGVFHLPAKGIGLAHRRLSIIDLSPLWESAHVGYHKASFDRF